MLTNNDVIITTIVNPGTFYANLYSYVNRVPYEAMLEKLADHAHYSQHLVGLRSGRLGMLMDEDEWHRVKVLGITRHEALEIECVDLER
jgi:nitroreductase